MDAKNIYGKSFIFEEIAAIPLYLYDTLFKDNVYNLLNIVKANSIENAKKEIPNKKQREILMIKFGELDDFFSINFNKIVNARHLNFDEKIDYCYKVYLEERRKKFSFRSRTILRDNFLFGAKKCIFLYKVLNEKVTNERTLSDIIIDSNVYITLIDFLKKKKFIDLNRNLIVDNKSFFIRIHRLLKDELYINPDFNDVSIIEAMENEYNTTFDRGTFSKAINTKLTNFEKQIHNELLELLKTKK